VSMVLRFMCSNQCMGMLQILMFLFFFSFFFFNCGSHELFQSNFSLLIHDTEIYRMVFSSTFSIHLRCDKMYIYMVVGFFLVKSVFFFFRKIFAAIF